MERRLVGVPAGAVLAGTQHGRPVTSTYALARGAAARQLPYVEAEWTPPITVDERHCQWVEGDAQCRSWPVKKDNPQRFCAGHLKKVAATNGPQSPADQGLRTTAP